MVTRKEEIIEEINGKIYKIIFEIENDLNWEKEDLDFIKRAFRETGSEKGGIAKNGGYVYWKIKKV